ncbi:dienelactone hydrolase family protein [Pseudenhygromyxa sp. WMMC2535]|uniref:alpha/beta hydrolase n=1 Tax=Pseudenhygromyxa sp. WMMC2535 TaxID=2712867 RepID=UPI001553E76B|nr:dienelactone hydrolase family protein [Pseudenhygromyxa sp. WMMC2535]
MGNSSFVLEDPEAQRDLLVELWYPVAEDAAELAEQGQDIEAFVTAEPDASTFAALVDAGPDACVRKQSRSAGGQAPALPQDGEAWPTVVFSHCHGCARFSSYTLAEHLASHGFMVAAVDHAGSTVFDELEDALPDIDEDTLATRAQDIERVIDELLDPAALNLPAAFVGLADGERLGMFGHSFGSVTTGKVLQDDPRVKAGVGLAAPFENPLLPGVTMADIDDPLMLVVAVEDNSITEFGNNAIRSNFQAANTPAWKLEFADTGHFGFSDLAGLYDYFEAGCGEGIRQTNDEAFTYLDPFVVRELAAGRIAAFFGLHLLGDALARDYLEAQDPLLEVSVRE